MHLPTRPIQPEDHVLIALGHNGHPTFKTIHTDEAYLEQLGKHLVTCKKSQYETHMVVSSHNVFTLTNPDYRFDEALDQIIRNLILEKYPKTL
ncbi:MAG: hypothetical protein ACP5D0_04295 [Hydrogenovibrio sp.]